MYHYPQKRWISVAIEIFTCKSEGPEKSVKNRPAAVLLLVMNLFFTDSSSVTDECLTRSPFTDSNGYTLGRHCQ